MNKSKTRGFTPQSEWKNVNWRKLEMTVFKLQKRIYRASHRGDVRVVRKLQKTLMNSWSAKMIAVRRVTQENKGKKTAGIDGKKALNNKQRLALVANLNTQKKAKPTRRVWIPKSGSREKRPLGIPTIHDRALQALTKQALEPEWEAKFEPNSYGFRPGRSCHDAVEAIFSNICHKPKWVLDADIAKCFDKINHEALLTKVNTFPSLRRLIKSWLKAGVMEKDTLTPTNEGTPQGGVISPLLANIALHGMEERIKQYAETLKIKRRSKKQKRQGISLIRYADDFVIIHENQGVIEECRTILENWLNDIGLELKPSKTRISYTMNGFDFLGFNIRQYKVGKNQSKQGFKTIIKPSKKKVLEHYEQLSNVIDRHRAAPQEALINHLKPIIRGWCNYYRSVCSKETFNKLGHMLWNKLQRWGYRRHPNKSKSWVINKYWGTIEEDNWMFMTDRNHLPKHVKTEIVRHKKVQEARSTYDGDLIYWNTRMQKHPEMTSQKGRLLKRQKGVCTHCGLTFRDGDVMEKHHIIPRSLGGNDTDKNLELLHLHCHDAKHRKKIELNELDRNPF
ncbi:group II intron reverse transcriptase/maturase [Moorena producens PAL-8-15-08-1]|uniref:Group II intron reverse transcriptase/maturase n=1 Tax=Moorena producens PAL-8-15-08-1 TaxID=1458985 RepID=A0A1D8TRF4_9CYAN|nr:group II intron reverse transcriptase/maturase [Moorena producens]AOW98396.1 group II intron reverse transcriptase/maturase [Moorena producens PAL-8-15-08-1]AOW98844.1 group II intron reverse transcriptase/maturase [Moorena producens PAL-8-15-08-1]AOW99340.1 group II intron reverse transcriptase/maturase [Moorena producens PAL-8-15-08-1]AOX00219.1 group II intron reverse transcriptase/maturase [Moorena producens PAL-8-15-08-1]AOX02902.1 group II intron reverse transcriptase/maturase [Mooren